MARQDTPSIMLRQAVHGDKQLCYAIHKDAMQDAVSQIWGWDEADQVRYFDDSWDPGHTQIVLIDGEPGGVLMAERRPAAVYVSRVEIYKHLQSRGIGSSLIRHVQEEAKQLRLPLLLEVFTINAGAQALYRRLGFRVVETTGNKMHMKWDPAA